MSHKLFITGGSGYVGAMLVEQFAKRADVEKIVALDKEPRPASYDNFAGKEKIEFIQANTADDSWIEKVKVIEPDIVIHTAWQIREIYGDRPLSWKWNIVGSDKVFDFAFDNKFVKRLVHYSTVASYGAFEENTLEQRFTEKDSFRVTKYLYAEEKRVTEEHLWKNYNNRKSHGQILPIVSIIRPAAITGPRGRIDRVRFGLQSALSGKLKGGVYGLVSFMTQIVPVTPKWLRQYIHEDDINDITELLAFDEKVHHEIEAFNACPPGDCVLGPDMAKAVGKKAIVVSPLLIRFVFFWFWHLTKGRIPTAEGSWKGYSYPIAVDGKKITDMYGYTYKYEPLKAFVENVGRYKK
jgi:nucleoside-diphosphate-sugar epimerase